MDLFERDHFLHEMADALAAARGGAGSVLLVCGEAGIGKTALVDRFAALAGDAATRCLRGACDAFFTPRVLGPLFDIARSAGGRFETLARENPERERLYTVLLDELQRPEGTVVIVEDVHWADEATLDLLRFLARRIRDTSAVLVITFRDDELPPRHPLRAVLAVSPRAATRRLTLPRLSRAVVEGMATRAGRRANGLYALTGGNPFFVTEVLAADGAIPASVADAVYARAAQLAPAARAVLDAVSLAPRHLERWLLDVVMEAAPAAIDDCLAVGILEARGDALAFRHEIARRAWQDTVEPGQARALHARMLAALSEATAHDIPMTRLVHHAAGAGDSETLLRLAPQAGHEAAQLGAHREAAAHYATALAAAHDVPMTMRAELLEALTVELFLIGDVERIRSIAEEALALRRELQDLEGECRCLRWLSRLTWYAGESETSRRYAEAAVALLEGAGPSAEKALAYSGLGGRLWDHGELDAALGCAERACDMAAELNAPKVLAHALNTRGSVRIVSGDGGGRDDVERSLELALEHGFQDDAARARINLVESAVEVRDVEHVAACTDNAVRYCTDLDLGPLAACALGSRALFRTWRGDWGDAIDDADLSLAHPSAMPMNRIRPLVVLGQVRARRGDPGVWTVLDEAAAIVGASREVGWRALVVAARAEAAWLEGRLADLRAEIVATHALAAARQSAWWLGAMAQWMAALRESVPPSVIARCPVPHAQQLRGEWPAAARSWSALGFPYEQALALARCQTPGEHREALTILRRLGATRTAEVVAGELRERGVRHIPRGPRPATRSNPAQLTRQQVRVLALMAEGLSNADIARRLFITPKTAEHHVGAVLVKLGAASRIDAVNRAHRLGIVLAPAGPVK